MRKIMNLVGQVYGKLTVLEYSHKDKFNNSVWKCLCSCGNTMMGQSNRLRRGHTKSCGCFRLEDAKNNKHAKLEGKKFGKLTVKSFSHLHNYRTYWNCICDCGKEVTCFAANLIKGNSQSCGCKRNKTHPNVYIARVINQYRNRSYVDYGCDFSISIEEFEKLILDNCHYCGKEPSNKLSKVDFKYNGIDRLNSNLGYIEGNCVTCCKHCNIAKNTMTYSEFNDWIDIVYNFKNKRTNSDEH